MNRVRRAAIAGAVAGAVMVVLGLSVGLGQEWPGIRGANGQGSIRPEEILKGSDQVELRVRWKKKIGSGYSSLVLSRDRLIALYSLGPRDVAACLSQNDGRTIWEQPIGDRFVGQNGSFDGPLSTPVIHRGRVIIFTPRGVLLALSLDDGATVWRRDLVAEEKAVQPMYGFATSPVIAGGHLIVQVGIKDKALMAFDADTGKTIWGVGDDEINAQTPSTMAFEGREVVLAVGGKKLMGVDPRAGKVLFDVEHGGGNAFSTMPVALNSSTVLLTLDDEFSSAFKIASSGGPDPVFTATKLWTDRSIKNTYNIPALCNDAVFAYSTRFLTCVDPSSGAAHWKQREPGDGFLIAVDGKVVVTTKAGSFHIIDGSSGAYREWARLQVFDDLVWSVPAYAGQAVFQRSLGEVARVDIVAKQGTSALATAEEMPLGEKFRAFLAESNRKPTPAEKQAAAEAYLAAQKSFPIIEDNIVHFVFRGPHSDVAVAGDMFGARQERSMRRLDGTDVFYYALKLPSDQRVHYLFLADYQPVLDPLNPRHVTSSLYAGELEFAVRLKNAPPLELNVLTMPEWTPPTWQGKLDSRPLDFITETIAAGEQSKLVVDVLLPSGYDPQDKARRYPVVYVFDGSGAKKFGELPAIARALFAADPGSAAILVLVDASPMQEDLAKLLVEQIVPQIDAKYATQADREGRAVLATGFMGMAALSAVGQHSQVFSAASVQSPLIFDAGRDALKEMFGKLQTPVRVYVEWGRFDMFNPHENWDMRTMCQTIRDAIAANPIVTIAGGEVNDSTDWASWKNRFEPVLKFLIAAPRG